ncbi:MAG: hypothetical protein IPK19_41575 [Chloroflexi bacterium]|nr:hypothetical protein [Chloroflexota bacterium]
MAVGEGVEAAAALGHQTDVRDHSEQFGYQSMNGAVVVNEQDGKCLWVP